jgi:hypothetical protein
MNAYSAAPIKAGRDRDTGASLAMDEDLKRNARNVIDKIVHLRDSL